MWFAGLLIGMVLGATLGHGAGALAGAIVGAIAGAAYRAANPKRAGEDGESAQRLAEIERKIDHIYKSLEDIHWRLVKLEKPGEEASPRPLTETEAPAAPPVVESVAAAREAATCVTESRPPEVAAAMEFLGVTPAVESVGMESSPAQIRKLAGEAARLRAAIPEPPQVATPTPNDEPPLEDAPAPALWQRLLAGNIVAKVGAIILFFGVGFLLKYAYDRAVLPVPVRLASVALAGLAMQAAGWRVTSTRRLYGLILQGAGIGVLYLDVFFALRVFALIHPTAGFTLFMLLGIAATLLAVRQDAKVLAVIGLTGAFLAPILASSGSGQHVVLFSYYMLLNAFILVISWFKAWRDLNLTGFIFTFLVGVFWGSADYRPELFASVEPFVLIFFAIYLVIPILFAQRQPPQLKGLVDGTLVFGTPLSVAFMQAGLVRDLPYGLAWSAGIGAALYAVLALMVLRREGLRLLGEAYIALAVVLATMAIFFALDAYPTFALWTLEGAAIVWVGLRQQRVLARIFGIALQFAGAGLFLLHYSDYDRAQPWLNDFVLGCGLIAAAGAITAWLMHRHREVLIEGGDDAATTLLAWAFGWWFVGGLHALHDGLSPRDWHAAALIFAATTFALAETIGGWLEWAALRLITRAHLLALLAGLVSIGDRHPLADLGAVAWPLSFIVFFWCLHWQAKDGITIIYGARYRSGWLLLAAVATWEAWWLYDHQFFEWCMLMAVGGITAGALRYHLRERDNVAAAAISQWALLWGLALWLLAGLALIDRRFDDALHVAYGLGFLAVSCTLFEITGAWCRWPALRRVQWLLLPAMLVALFMQFEGGLHPGADDGWMAWLAAYAAFAFILRRQQHDAVAIAAAPQTVLASWLATGLVAWELAWQCAQWSPGSSWAFAMWGAVPAIALCVLTRYGAAFTAWRNDFGVIRYAGLGPLAVAVTLWSLKSSWDASDSAPLPYLPLFNPVDLAQIAALPALRVWLGGLDITQRDNRRTGSLLLAALGFAWLNCVLLRSLHHWLGVPYEIDDMYNSIVVQSALSIVWTLTALVMMVFATRGLRRGLWLAGAVLLAVVVGKLFLLDLANSGTVERIVSFLGVGVLLMIIGYLAPVPPGDAEQQTG